MRYVRLDDDKDRQSVADAKAAEERKLKRKQDKLLRQQEMDRIAEEERRREEEKFARALERERQQENTRVEVVAARKTHMAKNAPSLQELADKDQWTPEDLAYVRYYIGSSSAFREGVRLSRMRGSYHNITLYGKTFAWDGLVTSN
ncbi:hypothetical protein CC53_gp173 [Rhizobium phage vB_RleS_L338C]|uniref:hypothetical protein n=1 Tax=Rhizobium phage vB_RleS_L338C TaxID=1414737 RepID=UPI0003D82B67|nr:hypothetical protein CC53_gp173 [Rhizobium phage vB_RleS_L338C]AHC30590.1 hypothetical protein L338C_173 [Rhizobium phage vB_RleS_L338C]